MVIGTKLSRNNISVIITVYLTVRYFQQGKRKIDKQANNSI